MKTTKLKRLLPKQFVLSCSCPNFFSTLNAIQKKSIIFASLFSWEMKYAELERKLRKIDCYATGDVVSGHPEWYSPRTGKYFAMSHHRSEEVAAGTLKSIKRDAGLE